MSTPKPALTPGEYVEWLRVRVHEKEIPSSNRVRAAVACFGLAQEHHHSIVLLAEHRLYGSVFALLRVAFEAYIRGKWLLHCASDEQLSRFLHAEEPPKIDQLLVEIEGMPGFEERILSQIKRNHWRTMCAYTHTGGLQVQRWQSQGAVEPSYASEEVAAVVNFAEIIGSVATLSILGVANDEASVNEVIEHFRSRPQVI